MSFAIFGALVFWGLLWLVIPRASFAALLVVWLELAHPNYSKVIAAPLLVVCGIIAVIGGGALDIYEHYKAMKS